ncbi:MAG TPA: zf-HC2 domain-containing protein [Leptolinea sp.]
MKCEDIVQCMSDYIDGDMPIEVLEEAEQHLATCSNCTTALKTLRETIQVYKLTGKAQIAPEHRENLLAAIQEAVISQTQ